MKIDVYNHFFPPKLIDLCSKHIQNWSKIEQTGWPLRWPPLYDVEKRLNIIDQYEDYAQILVPSGASGGFYCSPKVETELARAYNDEVAELTSKHPDKFVGSVAYIPFSNIDAALAEIERTIDRMGFKGIYLETPVYNIRESDYDFNYESVRPIDISEYMPIYASMAKRNLPIWLHPRGVAGVPVYKDENRGRYKLSFIFGWPLESAMAMARLVFSGTMARYPNLKIIVHHCGSSIVPILGSRIDGEMEGAKGTGNDQPRLEGLFKTRSPSDWFRMFYADTALYGDIPGIMCTYSFFGAGHILFGTDFPYDMVGGHKYIPLTIEAIKNMDISAEAKARIFWENAVHLLHLDSKIKYLSKGIVLSE